VDAPAEAWRPISKLMDDLERLDLLTWRGNRGAWVVADIAARSVSRIIDEREEAITELELREEGRRRRIGRFLRRLAAAVEES
jgi:hypothetical protein